MTTKHIPILILILSLTSCALFGGGSSKSNKKKKSSLPKAAIPKEPGGQGSNWRYLGTSDDDQVITEIDNNSIKLINQSERIYYYKDRKTIKTPSEFNYPNNIKFKYAISEWNISCLNKRYTLIENTTYNESGAKIKETNYQEQNAWRKIDSDSIADSQYQYICNNKNRNLGY